MNKTEALKLASEIITKKMGPGEGTHCVCVVAHTIICVRPLMVPPDAAVLMKLTGIEMENGLTSSRWTILDGKLRGLVKGGLL